MNEREAILLLQRYRHDVSNHLQLVHGYLSMGMAEMAREKVDEWMSCLAEERKLSNLQAPKFTLWVMQCNTVYNRLRLTYHIRIEHQDLSHMDEKLASICGRLARICMDAGEAHTLHEASLLLERTEENLSLQFFAEGPFSDDRKLQAALEELDTSSQQQVDVSSQAFSYRLTIPSEF